MRTIAAALLALLAVAAPATAATRWTVDHGKSRLGFTVLWSGQAFDATFKSWTADIVFDAADLAHSHAIVNVDLGSEISDTPDDDDGLKGAEGFSITQFPTAHFETTGFAAKGGNQYVATGRLSLHGVTRTIALPFSLAISGRTAHMTGKIVVLRTDFGLGRGDWAGETPIAHAVTITIDLTATKAG